MYVIYFHNEKNVINNVSFPGDRPVPCGSADVGDYGSRGWASSRANWSHAAVAEAEAEVELEQKLTGRRSSVNRSKPIVTLKVSLKKDRQITKSS